MPFLKPRVELVTFPYDTPVVEQYGCMDRLPDESDIEGLPDTFVRPIDIRVKSFSCASLERLLAKADRELSTVAEMCEAEVVPHTWGLIVKGHETEYRHKVPHLWSLVAQVDRIQRDSSTKVGRLNEPEFNIILNGIRRYDRTRWLKRYGLPDMGTHQFMYGTNARLDSGKRNGPKLFLVDVEPLFRLRTGICL